MLRFLDGAAQFREDVAVNPNDTEEAIWSFLCEARIRGEDEARKDFLEVMNLYFYYYFCLCLMSFHEHKEES